MAKYNLTTIVPEGFMHHHAFDEVRDSLSWSLASLGHDVSLTENWFSESGETNVILGAELIADFQRLPKGTILFNLEQPSHPNMSKVRRMVTESGCRVWDYSLRAVEEWKAAGHADVRHVPIGWTPNLTRIPRVTAPDIDICFFGWMTPRRIAILDALRAAGLNVYASAACYGGGRDNIISRSKIALNIHHDGRDRFEVVRCSYLMANSIPVVTEPSSDDDEYSNLLRSTVAVPCRLLVDACVTLCRDSASHERATLAASAFDAIQRRDFTTVVAAALAATSVPLPESTPSIAVDISEAPPKSDSRVASRYAAACASGDMKDFAPWLRAHAKGNVMEIGVRDGASTSAFLSGLEENGGHLYSIDVAPCGHLFADHPQWTFLQSNSTDLRYLAPRIPYEIDLLLIDGDHSRAGALNDFNHYAGRVRPGGLILFHDIAPEAKIPGADDSWPGDDVKNVYRGICMQLASAGWTHEELPGRYGMGVLHKPAPVLEATSR